MINTHDLPAVAPFFKCTPLDRPILRVLLLACAALLGVSSVAGSAFAAEYFVAPSGSDMNPGTIEQPFATLQKGHDAASAGDTVWLRGGEYPTTRQIRLSKSGQSDAQRIEFFAYQAEVPVIDFSGYVSSNRNADVPALLVTGSWLHLRGLEVANVPVGASGDHSISAIRSEDASNNIYELLNIHHNFGPGLFISGGEGGNLILNCDSHDNYDKDGSQGDGQNADGFGVHYQETGPSTIISGCRAWLNSDDGYDYISQEVPVITQNSWAVRNGFSDGGAGRPASGNGNGFKAGSSRTGIRHVLQNNVAWMNRASGFYANHSSGGNDWFNNTSYNNGTQFNMLASTWDSQGNRTDGVILTGDKAHVMRNNIGFPNKNSNMDGVDSQFNTWDLNISEMEEDFVSTLEAGWDGPRQANGSLPAIDFLKLSSDSSFIDQGTDVGLEFTGDAPDLGAYEYGLVMDGGGGADAGGAASGMAGSVGGAGDTAAGGLGGVAGSSEALAGSDAMGTAGTETLMGSGFSDATADQAGCGCRTAGSDSTRGWFLFWLTLGGLAVAARRRLPH